MKELTVKEDTIQVKQGKEVLKTVSTGSMCVAVVGGRGSGKTALSYSLLEASGRPRFLFQHPRLNALPVGFHNLNDFSQLLKTRGAAVFIDEVHLHLPRGKGKEMLVRLLTLCRHVDVMLILASSDSRYFSVDVESFVDAWMVMDCNYDLLKRGGQAQTAIKEFERVDPKGFSLSPGDFLVWGRRFRDAAGQVFRNELPSWWDDSVSKAYAR